MRTEQERSAFEPDAVDDRRRYVWDGKPVTQLGKQLLLQILKDINDDMNFSHNGAHMIEEEGLIETYKGASGMATASKSLDPDWQTAENHIMTFSLKK